MAVDLVVVAAVDVEAEGIAVVVEVVSVTEVVEMLLDQTEAEDRPRPERTHMPGTHIRTTTMTGHTHPGCPQMIDTPMTERGGYPH